VSASKKEFRLLDETGLSVAEAYGPGALNEILHYFLVYQQDGKHTIQERVGRKWIDWTVTFTESVT
jgi:hypothetical protein